MFGCDCAGNCGRTVEAIGACSCFDDGLVCYNKDQTVRIGPSDAVIKECNDNCTCTESCINRVVQYPSSVKMELFWCGERGWGLRAREHIKRNTYVAQYLGELISEDEADRRDAERKSYHFALDFNRTLLEAQNMDMYIVDASRHGNISRFFNHSCDPNMAAYCVQIESTDPNMHHLAFFTKKDVAPGTELTFDYSSMPSDGAVAADHKVGVTVVCVCVCVCD
ncbi:hypothetical protein BC831DRAFT_399406 [Entophlyctis helioformis]|nr:hypothetical protein BC831DRAFT_399406 [Entophlyctis helioformis]